MDVTTPLLIQNPDGQEDEHQTVVNSLLETAKQFFQKAKDVGEDIVTVITDNPKQTCLVIACGVVFIAPVVVLCPLLGAAGFGAAGPVAGSLAAAWQASMGSVAAGSLFALLEGAAMGGVGAAILGGVVQLGAMSVLGIAFRKQIANTLVNTHRTVLRFAQDQIVRAQLLAMQTAMQSQNIRNVLQARNGGAVAPTIQN